MKAIADEAHMWGLQVAAHAHGASGINDAILAGIDTIEHASLIDDEGIAAAKKWARGFRWTSTTPTTRSPKARRTACWRTTCARTARSPKCSAQNFRKAHAAGVKMVYGTDAGVYPHGETPSSSPSWSAMA